MKRFVWLSAAILGLSVVCLPASAASPRSFKGNSCTFRAQLWGITQSVDAAFTDFNAEMDADYGSDNPYGGASGDSQPIHIVHLSSAAVAYMQKLDTLVKAPPHGLIPLTWNIARQYGMNKPFGGKLGVPKAALRSVFDLEFALAETAEGEMKDIGGGSRVYDVVRLGLPTTWALLKAVPCK